MALSQALSQGWWQDLCPLGLPCSVFCSTSWSFLFLPRSSLFLIIPNTCDSHPTEDVLLELKPRLLKCHSSRNHSWGKIAIIPPNSHRPRERPLPSDQVTQSPGVGPARRLGRTRPAAASPLGSAVALTILRCAEAARISFEVGFLLLVQDVTNNFIQGLLV